MFGKIRNFLEYQLDIPKRIDLEETAHLDLGCGATPRNPFGARDLFGTDFEIFNRVNTSTVNFIAADLTKPLPFDSHMFSSISAFDVLEHVPRWERLEDGTIVFPFVSLMDEVHRLLKPGGVFLGVTPAFPSPAAFQDPTHVNIVTRKTLSYFVNPARYAHYLGYGFNGGFEIIYENWLRGGGPYAAERLSDTKNLKSKKGLVAWVKYLNRLYRAAVNQKPTHLIWVLRKPE